MGGLCSPSLFIFAVTCCLLHMISRSRKASNSTHIYSSSAVSIRIITLGVCVWCFIKWGWDAEQHRPMLWFCCCFCMDAWFNQLHAPPPLAAVCSSALITLQIVLLMFFLCLFTMGGGRDGCGLVERCTAVGVNCYLLSTDSEPILTSSQSCMELNQAKTSDSTGALSLKFQ